MSVSEHRSLLAGSKRLNSHSDTLRFLFTYVGLPRTAFLACLLTLTSLTEGFGLLLLVPVTQVIVGDLNEVSELSWMTTLSELAPGLLLALVASLICLRAALVYRTNQLRIEIDLSLIRALREDAYRALVSAEWRWLSGRESSEHEALLLGESSRAGMLVDQALFLGSAGLTLVVLIATALLISPPLTLGVIAVAVLLAFPILISKGRSAREAEAYADAYAELHRRVSGGVAHLRSAKIAGAGSLLEQQLSEASDDLLATELRYVRRGNALTAMIQGIAAIVLGTLVYFALVRGTVALSVFIPLLALLARAALLSSTIVQGFRQWQHAQPALLRIQSFIAEANRHGEEKEDRASEHSLTLVKGIELEDVTLAFDEREQAVLTDLSCTIPAARITAVLGPSGSGKSCLADLVSGMLEPDSGTVSVDGILLAGERRLEWRDNVAYAEQTPYLFSASIADNVTWSAKEVSREQVSAALKAASADFVLQLPDGMDTLLAEEGRSLSVGERQRIGLARALVREPRLLILDEVTASLDHANRTVIHDAIASLRGRCTVVILTHDDELASIADHVIDLGEMLVKRHG